MEVVFCLERLLQLLTRKVVSEKQQPAPISESGYCDLPAERQKNIRSAFAVILDEVEKQ